MAQVNKRK